MNEIEKIKRYIDRTGVNSEDDRYYLTFYDARTLAKQATDFNSMYEIIALAFNYGKAKGYRRAKAEAKKAVSV